MSITLERKSELVQVYRRSEGDTTLRPGDPYEGLDELTLLLEVVGDLLTASDNSKTRLNYDPPRGTSFQLSCEIRYGP